MKIKNDEFNTASVDVCSENVSEPELSELEQDDEAVEEEFYNEWESNAKQLEGYRTAILAEHRYYKFIKNELRKELDSVDVPADNVINIRDFLRRKIHSETFNHAPIDFFRQGEWLRRYLQITDLMTADGDDDNGL